MAREECQSCGVSELTPYMSIDGNVAANFITTRAEGRKYTFLIPILKCDAVCILSRIVGDHMLNIIRSMVLIESLVEVDHIKVSLRNYLKYAFMFPHQTLCERKTIFCRQHLFAIELEDLASIKYDVGGRQKVIGQNFTFGLRRKLNN